MELYIKCMQSWSINHGCDAFVLRKSLPEVRSTHVFSALLFGQRQCVLSVSVLAESALLSQLHPFIRHEVRQIRPAASVAAPQPLGEQQCQDGSKHGGGGEGEQAV